MLCAALLPLFSACKHQRAHRKTAPGASVLSAASLAPTSLAPTSLSPTPLSAGPKSAAASLAEDQTATAPNGEALRFLIIGGGPTPESNEVSLEQDVNLVRQALPGPGRVLFAGGGTAPTVRESGATQSFDELRFALGELFEPRPGRHSHYRLPRFQALPATRENVETELSRAFAHGRSPLLVYIAGHGEKGDDASQNAVALWGNGALNVARLAELHEAYQRPMRLVATTCFSGGFAELAFAHADAHAGQPSSVPRCGLFAGTWDRETSGCDPNPDRRSQESYGAHLTHALLGQRKDGRALTPAELDFDADGSVGLLDAHTWAQIEAVSFDVPTTTSERWLRAVEPGSAAIDAQAAPEAQAVVERLGHKLGLRNERNVEERWAQLDATLARLNEQIDKAEDERAQNELDLQTALLERWPVLDDPFHPEFESTFAQNREAIAELLLHSPSAHAATHSAGGLDRSYAELDRLSIEEARVMRVRRAYETLHKASALLKRGGKAANYYRQLVACERLAP